MLSHSNNDQGQVFLFSRFSRFSFPFVIAEFTHTFNMSSAYSSQLMPFTNYTFEFKGIIDYIFYPKLTMKPLGILGPISDEWLKEGKIIGCPHPHIPSDHFSLLVEMGLTLDNTNAVNNLVQQPPPSLIGLNRRKQPEF